jgi:NitT/TauT family transport system substrate-binding protein
MMMRKLVIPVALCLTAAVVGLPAVHGAAAPPRGGSAASRAAQRHGAGRAAAPIHLSIMVGGLSKQIYLPNMLAQRLGYFAQQGLAVTLIDEASGRSSENEVLAGGVQAGSGSYNHTIELQALGKYITDVVQLTIAPGEAEMVVTKKAGQIKSVKDLKGQNLGVTELGSGTQTLTTVLLTKVGIPTSQVHFVPVGAGDTFIAAIQHGTIAAGMTTEPTISRLVQSGQAKVLVDLRTPEAARAALGGNYPFICVFMQTNYVNSHKAVVQKLVNAYVKTLKWIHTHSAAQIAAMMPADYYAGNKALYLTALQHQLAMYSPDGKMPAGGPQFVLKTEDQTNESVQGKHIDLSKTYDPEFVNKANA